MKLLSSIKTKLTILGGKNMTIQIIKSVCKGDQDISHLIGHRFSILDDSQPYIEVDETLIPLHEEEYHILEM
jgi:hypothetical protein